MNKSALSPELLKLAQSTASSFDMWAIIIGIGFSIVGWGAWRYGRKMNSARHMLLGVGLMGYAYFTPDTWWSLGVGSFLSIFLFWP